MAGKRKVRPRKNAMFVDVANVCDLDVDRMMRMVRRQGTIEIAQGYGNFTNWRHLSAAAEKLFLHGVRLVHCPGWRNASGEWKDCADEIMMGDIQQFLVARPDIDRFIICTGDGHFVPAALRVRASGREVLVIAPPDGISRMLREVASRCLTVPPSEPRIGDGHSASDNGDRTGQDARAAHTHNRPASGNGGRKGRNRSTKQPSPAKPGVSRV